MQLVTDKKLEAFNKAYLRPPRPDRSKECHSLQFSKCIASLLDYYKNLINFYSNDGMSVVGHQLH